MALTKAQKDQLRKDHPRCYVCDALGVQYADLAGYEGRSLQYDHWLAQGLVGDNQADLLANQRPIHADPDGVDPFDIGWNVATRRNCHRGKSNKYTGAEWCEYVRISRKALTTQYSDALMPDRDPNDSAYDVAINWDEGANTVLFLGEKYPLMVQRVGYTQEVWKSFSTLVSPRLLWKDDKVQSRSANPERLAKFAWHLRDNPLLSPILCRWADSRLKVFDGNHRLCAFILARQDHPIPVTIFQGPDPSRFLSVAADAHDTLTQLKYQYTDKALKFSALNEHELRVAHEHHGENASEALAWRGRSPKEVALRIVGRISARLDDEGGWRTLWKEAGLTDPSWNEFLKTYAKLEPESAPFGSKDYLREEEFKNLCSLCKVFNEELFERLPDAKDSLKTKWWKRAHARFQKALAQALKHSLKLPNTPEHPAYTDEWNDYIVSQVRSAVINWRQSPAWREDTTANNEATIDALLAARGFTETYLMS